MYDVSAFSLFLIPATCLKSHAKDDINTKNKLKKERQRAVTESAEINVILSGTRRYGCEKLAVILRFSENRKRRIYEGIR
jgi:hypothetical protein